MRMKLAFGVGFGLGYYLGTMAGRERYEQIHRTVQKIRGSEAFQTAEEKAKAAVDLGVERAKDAVESAVESKVGNGHSSASSIQPYDPRP
jgi:hypothetical protein